jgi:hypothetical protein
MSVTGPQHFFSRFNRRYATRNLWAHRAGRERPAYIQPPRGGENRQPPRGGENRQPPRGGENRQPPRGGENRVEYGHAVQAVNDLPTFNRRAAAKTGWNTGHAVLAVNDLSAASRRDG